MKLRQPSRPTDVADMRSRLRDFFSADGVAHGLAFVPRADDVFIATYPKCGTTWVQQIVHGLRTGGSMDFDEITEVVPWIEAAFDLGWDLTAEQAGHPRAYKTHLCWAEVPKGGRHIYVIRDPLDVFVSYYKFFEGWFFESGSISMDEFAHQYYLQGTRNQGYCEHLLSWWPHRFRADVLFLCFEDLKTDLQHGVEQIAEFLEFGGQHPHIQIATEQATIEFMKSHERQFDDHLIRDARDPVIGLPPGSRTSKVRAGRVGDSVKVLSRDLQKTLLVDWAEQITMKTGLRDYAALRDQLRREDGHPHC